jgi:type I restriction enzyme, S subunit
MAAYHLPNGWVKTSVGEIADRIHYGYTASADNKPIGPKLLRITDIQDNSVNWASVPFCKIDLEEKKKYLLRNGDLVFARTGATVGKSYLIKNNPQEAVFASYLIRIIPLKYVVNEYLYYFFQSSDYWLQIKKGQVGIGQPNVNAQTLSKIGFPLPPFNEQKRIVAKVDELFSFLDAGVASLRAVQVQLKRYRQAVLKAAFEGKLTEQWRLAYADKIESVSRLLERMRKKQEELGIKKIERLPFDEVKKELPEGWAWFRLSDVTLLITDGKHGDCQNQENSNYYFLSAKDIVNGKLDYTNSRQITEFDFREVDQRTNLQIGDILLSNSGSIGKIAIAEDREKVRRTTFQKSVAIIKLIPNCMNPIYVIYQLRYNVLGLASVSKGTAQKNLLLKDLRDFKIPVAPLLEQNQIVAEIENRFTVAEEVQKTVNQSIAKGQVLRQTVLREAFAGKLVAQDSTDEPAEMLLRRIKTERLANKSINHNRVELSEYVK